MASVVGVWIGGDGGIKLQDLKTKILLGLLRGRKDRRGEKKVVCKLERNSFFSEERAEGGKKWCAHQKEALSLQNKKCMHQTRWSQGQGVCYFRKSPFNFTLSYQLAERVMTTEMWLTPPHLNELFWDSREMGFFGILTNFARLPHKIIHLTNLHTSSHVAAILYAI